MFSPAATIVLCHKKENSQKLASCVALRSNELGIFLPYSGLHFLLMQTCSRALVMTSANLFGSCIVKTQDEAQSALRNVADIFLHYNCEIVTRSDDSVTRIFNDKIYFLCRSRGYAPLPLAVQHPFAENLLALGADEKNTFALSRGDKVIV